MRATPAPVAGSTAVGFPDTTIRLSVGLEDPLDIFEDVAQALKA